MPLPSCPNCKKSLVEWLSVFGEPPRDDYYRCVDCRHVWSVPREPANSRPGSTVPGSSVEPAARPLPRVVRHN
jgi:hypothetical protein